MPGERTRRPRRDVTLPRRFVATENTGAVLMLAATLIALGWANSPWAWAYERLWTSELGTHAGGGYLSLELREWVNQGLMAVFFFVAGLEIRRELDMGELRERRRVATPVLAAVGGMVVPALLYLLLNAGEPSARGWAIVIGTDTAFALGVLSLSRGASPRARTFLLTLVVVDDAAALAVIAVAYTDELNMPGLLAAVALFGVLLVLRARRVRHGGPFLVAGVGMWLATLASGVHATIAGVALGLLATAYPPRREGLSQAAAVWRTFRVSPGPSLARRAARSMTWAVSPNERYQHLFHPWASYLVVPVFALANAGVTIDVQTLSRAGRSPITVGIVVGLVAGKVLGIVGVTWLASRPRLGGLPLSVPWLPLVGTATVAGIGFTVSLLVADIAFTGQELADAKVGILAASGVAAVLAVVVFRVVDRLPVAVRTAGMARLAAPIVDLAEPVDPAVDHLCGPPGAPATLVWYGDVQCPDCRRAWRLMEDLRRQLGDDLAVVFRHLPLTEIHPDALAAAEAAEAAASQGRFWPMLAKLYGHQHVLGETALTRAATEVGLDVARFTAEMEDRRHVPRIERDVRGADDSGAAGSPTFFINGQRYSGPLDLDGLAAGVRAAITAPAARR